MEFQTTNIPIQEITLDFATDVRLFVKREDLIHPYVSGNKFRKLKYNLAEAEKQQHNKLLTYGGAFSNHITAVAAAGKLYGFQTIGVIRGEELATAFLENPTLHFAHEQGMKLYFVSRKVYREKNNSALNGQLKAQFGRFYEIPEGGTNTYAVKGASEMIGTREKEFDTICCAIGTGGTIAGISTGAFPHQQIVGFPALKGDFLSTEIEKWTTISNWKLIQNYHFGGYGKVTSELIDFINTFKKQYAIPLDPIYTGKMMFGIVDMIKKGYFDKQNRILAIHTGGLQGIAGMNEKLRRKGKQIIV